MRVWNLPPMMCLAILTPVALAQSGPAAGDPESPTRPSLHLEYLEYEQRVHSTSENTELGEKTKLDLAFRYNYNPDTHLRLRLDIDPYRYPEENKASKFEVRLFHRYENLEIQADLDINGDDNGRGATTFGPDEDSDDTFLAYKTGSFAKAIFYPYNFGGEVGREFRTLDVTRLYYIEGNPSGFNEIKPEDARIRTKTVPGFELQVYPAEGLTIYAGIGSAAFEYPASADFDIKNGQNANVWKIKEDRGYKGGIRYAGESTRVDLEYVTHTNADLTGSLLESAASLQVQQSLGPVIVDLERTYTRAGTRAYKLAEDGRWFDNSNGYNPIFVDYFRREQDWLGKTDYASMVQFAYDFGTVVPFIAYKEYGEYFIFRKRESAEKLRTVSGEASHGGLKAVKLGTQLKVGKFVLRPEVEVFEAQNAVYGNRQDLQEFEINSDSYGTKNTVFTLYTQYDY